MTELGEEDTSGYDGGLHGILFSGTGSHDGLCHSSKGALADSACRTFTVRGSPVWVPTAEYCQIAGCSSR